MINPWLKRFKGLKKPVLKTDRRHIDLVLEKLKQVKSKQDKLLIKKEFLNEFENNIKKILTDKVSDENIILVYYTIFCWDVGCFEQAYKLSIWCIKTKQESPFKRDFADFTCDSLFSVSDDADMSSNIKDFYDRYQSKEFLLQDANIIKLLRFKAEEAYSEERWQDSLDFYNDCLQIDPKLRLKTKIKKLENLLQGQVVSSLDVEETDKEGFSA